MKGFFFGEEAGVGETGDGHGKVMGTDTHSNGHVYGHGRLFSDIYFYYYSAHVCMYIHDMNLCLMSLVLCPLGTSGGFNS